MLIWFILLTSVVIIIMYLLMIMPKIFHRYESSSFDTYYYAHRGLHGDKDEAPENSLAAFQLAIEGKYGIELDVQLSKDGVAVVFHDYSLRRVCGIEKNVNELTFVELTELRLVNSACQIPSLKQVLDLINGCVPLIIELKIEKVDTAVCSAVDLLLKQYKGLYCIQSFNPFALMWYKKHRPDIMRGQLSSNFIKDKESGNMIIYWLLQNLLLNFITKPDFISYNYQYRHMISFKLCHKLYGIKTFAWTIQSQETLEKCSDDFDVFIFDHFIPK